MTDKFGNATDYEQRLRFNLYYEAKHTINKALKAKNDKLSQMGTKLADANRQLATANRTITDQKSEIDDLKQEITTSNQEAEIITGKKLFMNTRQFTYQPNISDKN